MSRKTITKVSGTAMIAVVAIIVIVDMVASEKAGSVRASDGNAAGQRAEQAVPVEVAKPVLRPLTRALRMPATLSAGEKADLYAKTSGYVSKVEVDIGSRVVQGQRLVVIDVPEMADELRQAQAVLDAMESKAIQAETLIAIARAEVQRAEAERELSHLNYQRRVALREGNAIPQQELDGAKSKLAISDAQLEMAKVRVTSTEADVKVAQSEVAVAEARVARLETLMGYAVLGAPFAGVITERLVDPGAFVRSAAEGAAAPLLRIVRDDYIRLVLEIPESDAPFARVGTNVDIFVKALGTDPIQGSITRSAEALKANTRTMRTEVDLDNADGRLAPGMYAQVIVKLETKQQALMIPSKAIRVRGRAISVLVANGATVESRAVEIGYDDGIWVEITGGQLAADEQIIISADSAVAPGVTVKPVLVSS